MTLTLKTLLSLLMSLSLLFSTTFSYGAMKSYEAAQSMSCCQKTEKETSGCPTCVKNGNNCKDTCVTNCCCYNLVMIHQEFTKQQTFVFLDIHSKQIANYSKNYSYLFQFDIYKPPIYFLS